MYCHFCNIFFDTYKDFAKHMLEFHFEAARRSCSCSKLKGKNPDCLWETLKACANDETGFKDENFVLNKSEKDHNSDHSTVEENKSSDSRTFNTLTEKSYVSNQNMAANIEPDKCQKDTSPRKHKLCNIIKNKLVSNSTEPLKDFPRKGKSASYQKNLRKKSSADATEQPNSLVEKNNHLNSESVSTNCLPMLDNIECSDSPIHGTTIENESPFALLNLVPKKQYGDILNISLEELKKLFDCEPASNSNKLLKRRRATSVLKKQKKKKKKVSNFKKVCKLRKSVSHHKSICKPTEINQTNKSKNSFNEDNSSDLPTSVVNFQSTTNNILNTSLKSLKPCTVKNKTVSKKRVLKKKKSVSIRPT